MANQLVAIDREQLNAVTGGKLTVDQVRNGANTLDTAIPNQLEGRLGPIGVSVDLPDNPIRSALDFISYPAKGGK